MSKKQQAIPPPVLERMKKLRLPTGGSSPFRPKIRVNRRNKPDLVTRFPKRGPKKDVKGFVDEDDNIWIRDPAHSGYPDHWDVQKNDGEDYERVGDDGEPVKKAEDPAPEADPAI